MLSHTQVIFLKNVKCSENEERDKPLTEVLAPFRDDGVLNFATKSYYKERKVLHEVSFMEREDALLENFQEQHHELVRILSEFILSGFSDSLSDIFE